MPSRTAEVRETGFAWNIAGLYPFFFKIMGE
jgi:hypothetical protein